MKRNEAENDIKEKDVSTLKRYQKQTVRFFQCLIVQVVFTMYREKTKCFNCIEEARH